MILSKLSLKDNLYIKYHNFNIKYHNFDSKYHKIDKKYQLWDILSTEYYNINIK